MLKTWQNKSASSKAKVTGKRLKLGDGEGLQAPCVLREKKKVIRGILIEGTGKMSGISECQGFGLSSYFYEKVLVKVQREFKNSSRYWKFELSRVRVVGIILYTKNAEGHTCNYK